MSTPTLEERARTLAEKIHGGSMTEIALFVAEHVYKERRAAQVEALERAAEQAEGWTKKFGNPNGSAYEQGQNDMGFRVVSNFRAEADRLKNGGSL